MKQRNIIVIGVMLGACTTGIYSWYTRPGGSGEALANTPPLPAPRKASGDFSSLAPAPLPQALAANPPPAATPSATPDAPVETVATPPAERVTAPGERSRIRDGGRGRSRRDD